MTIRKNYNALYENDKGGLLYATFLKWINNNDIPVILAVVGAALNMFVSGLSVESAVYGAVMGLASTGLHQAFSRFIDGNKAEE